MKIKTVFIIKIFDSTNIISFIDNNLLFQSSMSSEIESMDSIKLDAKTERWSKSEETLHKILKKLHEDHFVITHTNHKLEKLKLTFNPGETRLLNLHTNIDPRIYTVPR